MKKTKVLFALWGIVVVITIGLLTTMGFMLKSVNIEYKKVEDELKEKAEKYTSDKFLFPDDGKSFIVKKSDLITEGYLEELKHDDDVCDGYVVVSTDKVVQYTAYIKCGKYTTKDYEKNLK